MVIATLPLEYQQGSPLFLFPVYTLQPGQHRRHKCVDDFMYLLPWSNNYSDNVGSGELQESWKLSQMEMIRVWEYTNLKGVCWKQSSEDHIFEEV